MERKKYIWCFLIGIILQGSSVGILAQSPEIWRKHFYQAYISGDMTRWKELLTAMEKNDSESLDENLQQVHYLYGYIGYLIGTKQYGEAKEYISRAENLLKKVQKEDSENASLYAYRTSLAGFKMAMNKMRSVTLGPQSLRTIQQAWRLDSTNIQVMADRANVLFYAPGLVGGDKQEALRLYRKSIETLEDRGESNENWFYLSLLTSLARAYQEMGEKEKASDIYNKILAVEPDYSWVRNELSNEK